MSYGDNASPAARGEVEERNLISSVAQDLLDTIVATFGSYGVALPTERFITIGTVAVENRDVLAVMYGGLNVGLPGNQLVSAASYEDARTLVFNVELWRKTPGLEGARPLKQDSVSDAAKATMDDSWILMEAAYAEDKRNLGHGIVASIDVSGPQGGSHGVSMALELQVP